MSAHGGSRAGSGRKRLYSSKDSYNEIWRRGHRRIWIENVIYSSWVSAKLKCGYSTDSNFASHLLSLEMRRRENDAAFASSTTSRKEDTADDPYSKRPRHFEDVVTSTPVQPGIASLDLSVGSIASVSESDVDVTGVTEVNVNDSCYLLASDSVILKGDDEKYGPDSDDSSSDDPHPSSHAPEAACTVSMLPVNFALEDALRGLDEDERESLSDSSSIDDVELSFHVAEHESEEESEGDYSESLLDDASPTTSSVQLTAVTALLASDQLQQPNPAVVPYPSDVQVHSSTRVISAATVHLEDHSQPQHASVQSVAPAGSSQPPPVATGANVRHPKLSRLEEQQCYSEELAMIREPKVLCSLDLIIELFKKCQHPGCANAATIKHHLVGPTLIVNWYCCSGHKGKFASSKLVNEIYANNLQVAASVLLSGNNFAKTERMASFLGLSFISDSTFYRMQRLYLIPCINEWWSWQREQLIQGFLENGNNAMIVCGDGQCDSPGHTAKNLCYFVMELVSGYILEVEVRDKRHVGLISSNMEKQALQISLQRLQQSLDIVEVVTDASSSIKKLIADNFTAVFHSLDVWHKAKSIRKCLTKVGNMKMMAKIKAWSEHIILHFWHCCSICKPTETTTDEQALQKMKSTWIGVLHHVCNQHEWTGGKCNHGELEEHELPWFDRRDKDFEALQKVILDPQLLDSFKYYVRFRQNRMCQQPFTGLYSETMLIQLQSLQSTETACSY
ncbi:uncharacterized protein LOC114971505 isoform X2 [Acropora millepora]|uniref:uncharacterized protein LOC114971505 isoform X2 n=1 Tax=Acropora millepora TaxID=45264 RepID=UPI001CF2A2FB|nr:uncharacterized protein LOC114971505 isoform X2 [Acropora millepora]